MRASGPVLSTPPEESTGPRRRSEERSDPPRSARAAPWIPWRLGLSTVRSAGRRETSSHLCIGAQRPTESSVSQSV